MCGCRLNRPRTLSLSERRNTSLDEVVAAFVSRVSFNHKPHRTSYTQLQSGVCRIRTAMAARLRQVLEESEKDDWSKQAAAEMEHALCRLKVARKRVSTKSVTCC